MFSLECLMPGQPWPPDDEVARLQEYRENMLLRKNSYKELSSVFPDWYDINRLLREDDKKQLKLFLGYFSYITRSHNALLWGTPPEITSDNEADKAVLADLVKSTGLKRVRKEVGWDVSSLGNGIFKIFREEDESICIQANSPDIWFPIVKEGSLREIDKHVLAIEFEREKKFYLKVEIHGKDEIEYRVYSLNKSSATNIKSQIDKQLPVDDFYEHVNASLSDDGLSRIEENPAGDFLIVPVSNLRLSNDIYGQSDYGPDLKSILKEILSRYTQINRILDKHTDPNIVAPCGSFKTWDPALEKNVPRAGGRLIEYDHDPGTSAPNIYYLESGQLASNTNAAGEQIHRLELKFCALSGMPPQFFGLELAGTAESGTALYYKMTNLLSRVADLKEEFDEALQTVIRVATKLQGAEIVPSIKWHDGLKSPFSEKAMSIATLVTSGLLSGEQGTILAMTELGYSQAMAEKVAMDSSRQSGMM